MRIGIILFYKNIKKQQYAHTKSVAARLVDSENLSKKKIYIYISKIDIYIFLKKQHAHTKSVARLVDSENWSNLVFLQKKTKNNNNTRTQKVLLD